MDVIRSLEDAEKVIQADSALRKSLQDCAVPINLLDLLDHGNGLNPGKFLYFLFVCCAVKILGSVSHLKLYNEDCFSRGLLRDALEQLAGLKRRKSALEMLGSAVQKGLNERLLGADNSTTGQKDDNMIVSKKRSRDNDRTTAEETKNVDGEPESKKIRSSEN